MCRHQGHRDGIERIGSPSVQHRDANYTLKVLVFQSAKPDNFISYVDVTGISAYRFTRSVGRALGEQSC
jgi:hypothetical protein